jgi:acetyltransferase-like isoleucine patch superfamily enzyme
LQRLNQGRLSYEGELLSPKVEISLSKMCKCKIGNIWAGAGNVKINLYETASLDIGSDVCMNSNVYILARKKIHIGNDVMFGPNVVVIDHDHDYRSDEWKNTYKCNEIHIGNNVWIGSNVTILRGSYIGDNCVIGAGMTVKGRFETNTIIYNKQEICCKEFMRKTTSVN